MQHQIVNVDQATAWNGDEGESWARDWERYDRSISAYREPMLAAASIADGERVLDFGCGNGQSSRDAARATPTGSVLGADLSAAMLEQARRQAEIEGLRNVDFVQADAQIHPFESNEYDLAISRFGSMFFADKPAAFANIGRALRPGGRMLLVVWQEISKNEQFATMFGTLSAGRDLPTPPPGAPSPFGLADPALGRAFLNEAGFTDVEFEPVEGQFDLGSKADDAFEFAIGTAVAQNLLADLGSDERATALDALHRALCNHETPDGVLFDSAVWFITARRP
jgi:SAM-dependent methyltransferase